MFLSSNLFWLLSGATERRKYLMKKDELEKYLPFLDEYDMSHEQKMEFVEAMNLVVTKFVDLAFDSDFDPDLMALLDDMKAGSGKP